jgi:hypothetical protein
MVPTFKLSQYVSRNMFYLMVIGPEEPSKPPMSCFGVSCYVQTIPAKYLDFWGLVLFEPGGVIQDQVKFDFWNWEIGFPELENGNGAMLL